jgi:hypothetical protein
MLRLTREAIVQSAPDLLFTTTEMLNRLMSDAAARHIIGIGERQGIELVLLDEVHTYEGVHGAQLAYLLRRWQYAVRKKVHFTALSATLQHAAGFLADLIGLPEKDVTEITPRVEDLEPHSAEYLLALRGDPVSGTSLLSTTIQTTMLMRRVIDPRRVENSFFGKKVFVFTDNLDVNNRLYHTLLDAEGHPFKTPLAAYRSARPDAEEAPRTAGEQFRQGQSWAMVQDIGHRLDRNTRLVIGRTSSQDGGVDRRADVVVATASLEVGYDDNEVGVVIQHKTPHGVASFLQRKGRAGRDTNMRPWTVVILSDFGRDRVTYQSYEQLFDPVLPQRNLPLQNRYVKRIQLVWAFMDWLTNQLERYQLPAKLWQEFSNTPSYPRAGNTRVQKKVLEIIELIARKGSGAYEDLAAYLASALKLDEREVETLCWEHPRPLLLGVLPTLQRQLMANWTRYDGTKEYNYTPLPEFAPGSLFADLNLPEVIIQIDDGQQTASAPEEDHYSMGIRQALQEFAPGRVSRRFGINQASESHWIALPDYPNAGPRVALPLPAFCPQYRQLEDFTYHDAEGRRHVVPCYSPMMLRISQVRDKLVKVTSNAQLDWQTQIQLRENPSQQSTPVPARLVWSRLVGSVSFYSHQQGNPVTMRRFALGSHAKIGYQSRVRPEIETDVQFTSPSGQPAALGYQAAVDAVCFRIVIPEQLIAQVEQDPSVLSGLKKAYFKYLIDHNTALQGIANSFQRDWLQQAYLAALIHHAAQHNLTLEQACRSTRNTIGQAMQEVLRVIFNVTATEDGGEERQRNHQRLHELCDLPGVTQALGQAAPVLWQKPDPAFAAWMQTCYVSTLASALVEACYLVNPTFSDDELLVDIEGGRLPSLSNAPVSPGEALIWISESTGGGSGIIEQIHQHYTRQTPQFYELVESALSASDFELVDIQLQRLIGLLGNQDAGLTDAIAAVRLAKGHAALTAAHAQLRNALQQRGILTIQPLYAAVNTRLLRPGSSPVVDRLLVGLLSGWRRIEERLGVDVDARLFAYLASQDGENQSAIREIIPDAEAPEAFNFSIIYSLLWPRGQSLRAKALELYSPYRSFFPPDRCLVIPLLVKCEIDVTGPAWVSRLHGALQEHGEALLYAPMEHAALLKAAVLRVQCQPVEVGPLFLYARVSGVIHQTRRVSVKLSLPEHVY